VGAAGALGEDALALEFEFLAVAIAGGVGGGATGGLTGFAGGHLLLDRFAFPSARHVSMVFPYASFAGRGDSKPAGGRRFPMKAWRIPEFGIEKLSLDEVPTPQAGPGEVLMRVHAVSLNYRDLMTVQGRYNPRLKPNRIPCSDGAGVVAAVGAGVTRVKPGDRVAGIFMQNWTDGEATLEKQKGALGGDIDGTLAEFMVLREDGVVAIPEGLSFEEAATLPCAGVTAWNAVVHAGRVKAGDTVLIQGTGGVSIFALQFAKAMGARVLGTSSSDEKLGRARKLGLDAGLNYRSEPDWAGWAAEQTGGQGVDLVVEVGGAGTFGQSLRAARVGGVVAQIGVLSGVEQPIQITPILHRVLEVRGIYVGSRKDFEEMNRGIAANGIKPVVDRVFPFEEARRGLEYMERGAHFGKIVISVAPEGGSGGIQK
jgi:NADPH:quinone reductase-like Zn-dependent oxidoreductase